jgi:hypothetical protein
VSVAARDSVAVAQPNAVGAPGALRAAVVDVVEEERPAAPVEAVLPDALHVEAAAAEEEEQPVFPAEEGALAVAVEEALPDRDACQVATDRNPGGCCALMAAGFAADSASAAAARSVDCADQAADNLAALVADLVAELAEWAFPAADCSVELASAAAGSWAAARAG